MTGGFKVSDIASVETTWTAPSQRPSQPDYDLLAQQVRELADIDRDCFAVLANASALLAMTLERINWAGFYLMDAGSLLLGPFQGKPACVRIEVGRGVCGTAISEGRVQRVADVHEFCGHIACDADSRSEIVVPIRSEGRIVGVLDIDSPEVNRFDEADEHGLTQFAETIANVADFSRLRV